MVLHIGRTHGRDDNPVTKPVLWPNRIVVCGLRAPVSAPIVIGCVGTCRPHRHIAVAVLSFNTRMKLHLGSPGGSTGTPLTRLSFFRKTCLFRTCLIGHC